MSIRLGVTDDHPLILEGIKNLLANMPEMELVASFYSGEDTLENI